MTGPCSVDNDRLLGQARVAFEGVLDLFLGGAVLLPGLQLLLEQFGPGAIEVDLLARALVDDLEAAALHAVERQRDKLLADDGALTELCAQHPELDVQQMRTLIRNARKEQAENKPPKAYREIFQILKSLQAPTTAAQDADNDNDNDDEHEEDEDAS